MSRPPESKAERAAIRDQLERILVNPLFRNSKRYPVFLRYVVERTLDGQAADLKERTLGVDVLGREPDYDTNLDPTVRITAGEIRKRLAQYYQEPGHETEIRIDLPSGSYVPEFRPPVQKPIPIPIAPAPAARRNWRKPAYLAAAAVALALVVAGVRTLWPAETALDRFWGPLLESPGPVLLCVGQRESLEVSPAANGGPEVPRLFELWRMGSQNMAIPDVITLSSLTALLHAKGRAYRIRGESAATFADMRDGPVVLIGGFNNDWTMRISGDLRFRFGRKDETSEVKWIEDRQNPGGKKWVVDNTIPYTELTEDYALVSRVFDPATERMAIVAAGLSGYGTMAAGEFLTNPAYIEALSAKAPRGWQRQNMQVVIATRVINGNSGPPRVLMSHYW